MNYNEIQSEFVEALKADTAIQKTYAKVISGAADFKTADTYAEQLGRIWSKVLRNAFDGVTELTNELGSAVLYPSLMSDYEMTAEVSALVQKSVNKRLKISLNPITAETNETRVTSIIRAIEGDTTVLDRLLSEDVLVNLAKTAVHDTIEKNAQFHESVGLKAYITRSSASGCCDWCESVSGTFEYGSQPDEFFRQHNNCDCVITYRPSKTQWKTIQYYTTQDKDGNSVRKQRREGNF